MFRFRPKPAEGEKLLVESMLAPSSWDENVTSPKWDRGINSWTRDYGVHYVPNVGCDMLFPPFVIGATLPQRGPSENMSAIADDRARPFNIIIFLRDQIYKINHNNYVVTIETDFFKTQNFT